MSEATLSTRMDKLEHKVDALASDMTEVKHGVKQLTDALSGDGLRQGVIAELNKRIDVNDKAVMELHQTCQYIQSRLMSADDVKDIKTVVSWFKGWKLVFLSILAILPAISTAILIFKALNP